MPRTAFLFPGQGSQYAGMGRDLSEVFPEVSEAYRRSSEALGFDLAELCFNGPEERLKLTEFAQPAILANSLARDQILKNMGLEPDFVAGHSLGEYSALISAGGIDLADGVRLVRLRGKLMSGVLTAGYGGMSAVIGLDAADVQDICRDIGGSVEVANINSPAQVVISGLKEDLERAAAMVKEKGARLVVPLAVSGPFHSSLMKPAADEFKRHLESSGMKDLLVPLVANVDARPHKKSGEILDSLIRQIVSPVRWEESMRYLISQGVKTAVEVGPKNVLSGLMKRIDPGVKVFTTDKAGDFEEIRSFMSSGGFHE